MDTGKKIGLPLPSFNAIERKSLRLTDTKMQREKVFFRPSESRIKRTPTFAAAFRNTESI